ncbi:hypothetical protein B0T11DRAFT_127946 [Plectosphaerella cucumerina]|uniref:Uncharacterized protein n=1 Tax=Plectosphaerella cucumerina TaxID=40658 RepID=A0A8K0X1M8_9PEZI|nr:hypothetical protein B0T11DRAFT_127946 [Plectosphaerella cucumerina]
MRLGVGRMRPGFKLYNKTDPDGDIFAQLINHHANIRPDLLLIIDTSLSVPGIQDTVRTFADVTRSPGWKDCVCEPKRGQRRASNSWESRPLPKDEQQEHGQLYMPPGPVYATRYSGSATKQSAPRKTCCLHESSAWHADETAEIPLRREVDDAFHLTPWQRVAEMRLREG